jgi:hypothetical protein
MSFVSKHAKLLITAVCCLAVGAGASAIATAGASTSSHAGAGRAQAALAGARAGALRRLARRTVHANLVVATRTGFANATLDRGKVDSVSGRQLTMTEGTKASSYKTVSMTIPSGARIRDNRQLAAMSAIKPGQRVIVLQAPRHTFVFAHTPRSSGGL